MRVRAERPEDEPAVAALVEGAFASAAHARLVDDLRSSAAHLPGLALVAERADEVVGVVVVSRAHLLDGPLRRPVGNLSPLAVAAGERRRGVGRALVAAALAEADHQGEAAVVLEGDPALYSRLGFEPAAPLGITIDLPAWAPPEAAQVARLAAWTPEVRGRVAYPPAFAAVDAG